MPGDEIRDQEALNAGALAAHDAIAGVKHYYNGDRVEVPETKELVRTGDGGMTRESALRTKVGLSEGQNYTDYVNSGGSAPVGFEKDHTLVMAAERRRKLYERHNDGELGWNDFLYEAYGRDIMLSRGEDVRSPGYWSARFREGLYDDPLKNPEYLSVLMEAAEQSFQSDSMLAELVTPKGTYDFFSGQELTVDTFKDLFGDALEEYYDVVGSWGKMRSKFLAGTLAVDPIIYDENGEAEWYAHRDGKLYKIGIDAHADYYTDEDGVKRVRSVKVGDSTWVASLRTGLARGVVGMFEGFAYLFTLGYDVISSLGQGEIELDATSSFYEMWEGVKNKSLLFDDRYYTTTTGFRDQGGNIDMDNIARGVAGAAGQIASLVLMASGAGAVGAATAKSVSLAGRTVHKTATAVQKLTRFSNGMIGAKSEGVSTAGRLWARSAKTAGMLSMKDFGESVAVLESTRHVHGKNSGELIAQSAVASAINFGISTAFRATWDDTGVTKRFGSVFGRVKQISKLEGAAMQNMVAATAGEKFRHSLIDTAFDALENVSVMAINQAVRSGEIKDGNAFETVAKTAGSLITNPRSLTSLVAMSAFTWRGGFGKGQAGVKHRGAEMLTRELNGMYRGLNKEFDTFVLEKSRPGASEADLAAAKTIRTVQAELNKIVTEPSPGKTIKYTLKDGRDIELGDSVQNRIINMITEAHTRLYSGEVKDTAFTSKTVKAGVTAGQLKVWKAMSDVVASEHRLLYETMDTSVRDMFDGNMIRNKMEDAYGNGGSDKVLKGFIKGLFKDTRTIKILERAGVSVGEIRDQALTLGNMKSYLDGGISPQLARTYAEQGRLDDMIETTQVVRTDLEALGDKAIEPIVDKSAATLLTQRGVAPGDLGEYMAIRLREYNDMPIGPERTRYENAKTNLDTLFKIFDDNDADNLLIKGEGKTENGKVDSMYLVKAVTGDFFGTMARNSKVADTLVALTALRSSQPADRITAFKYLQKLAKDNGLAIKNDTDLLRLLHKQNYLSIRQATDLVEEMGLKITKSATRSDTVDLGRLIKAQQHIDKITEILDAEKPGADQKTLVKKELGKLENIMKQGEKDTHLYGKHGLFSSRSEYDDFKSSVRKGKVPLPQHLAGVVMKFLSGKVELTSLPQKSREALVRKLLDFLGVERETPNIKENPGAAVRRELMASNESRLYRLVFGELDKIQNKSEEFELALAEAKKKLKGRLPLKDFDKIQVTKLSGEEQKIYKGILEDIKDHYNNWGRKKLYLEALRKHQEVAYNSLVKDRDVAAMVRSPKFSYDKFVDICERHIDYDLYNNYLVHAMKLHDNIQKDMVKIDKSDRVVLDLRKFRTAEARDVETSLRLSKKDLGAESPDTLDELIRKSIPSLFSLFVADKFVVQQAVDSDSLVLVFSKGSPEQMTALETFLDKTGYSKFDMDNIPGVHVVDRDTMGFDINTNKDAGKYTAPVVTKNITSAAQESRNLALSAMIHGLSRDSYIITDDSLFSNTTGLMQAVVVGPDIQFKYGREGIVIDVDGKAAKAGKFKGSETVYNNIMSAFAKDSPQAITARNSIHMLKMIEHTKDFFETPAKQARDHQLIVTTHEAAELNKYGYSYERVPGTIKESMLTGFNPKPAQKYAIIKDIAGGKPIGDLFPLGDEVREPTNVASIGWTSSEGSLQAVANNYVDTMRNSIGHDIINKILNTSGKELLPTPFKFGDVKIPKKYQTVGQVKEYLQKAYNDNFYANIIRATLEAATALSEGSDPRHKVLGVPEYLVIIQEGVNAGKESSVIAAEIKAAGKVIGESQVAERGDISIGDDSLVMDDQIEGINRHHIDQLARFSPKEAADIADKITAEDIKHITESLDAFDKLLDYENPVASIPKLIDSPDSTARAIALRGQTPADKGYSYSLTYDDLKVMTNEDLEHYFKAIGLTDAAMSDKIREAKHNLDLGMYHDYVRIHGGLDFDPDMPVDATSRVGTRSQPSKRLDGSDFKSKDSVAIKKEIAENQTKMIAHNRAQNQGMRKGSNILGKGPYQKLNDKYLFQTNDMLVRNAASYMARDLNNILEAGEFAKSIVDLAGYLQKELGGDADDHLELAFDMYKRTVGTSKLPEYEAFYLFDKDGKSLGTAYKSGPRVDDLGQKLLRDTSGNISKVLYFNKNAIGVEPIPYKVLHLDEGSTRHHVMNSMIVEAIESAGGVYAPIINKKGGVSTYTIDYWAGKTPHIRIVEGLINSVTEELGLSPVNSRALFNNIYDIARDTIGSGEKLSKSTALNTIAHRLGRDIGRELGLSENAQERVANDVINHNISRATLPDYAEGFFDTIDNNVPFKDAVAAYLRGEPVILDSSATPEDLIAAFVLSSQRGSAMQYIAGNMSKDKKVRSRFNLAAMHRKKNKIAMSKEDKAVASLIKNKILNDKYKKTGFDSEFPFLDDGKKQIGTLAFKKGDEKLVYHFIDDDLIAMLEKAYDSDNLKEYSAWLKNKGLINSTSKDDVINYVKAQRDEGTYVDLNNKRSYTKMAEDISNFVKDSEEIFGFNSKGEGSDVDVLRESHVDLEKIIPGFKEKHIDLLRDIIQKYTSKKHGLLVGQESADALAARIKYEAEDGKAHEAIYDIERMFAIAKELYANNADDSFITAKDSDGRLLLEIDQFYNKMMEHNKLLPKQPIGTTKLMAAQKIINEHLKGAGAVDPMLKEYLDEVAGYKGLDTAKFNKVLRTTEALAKANQSKTVYRRLESLMNKTLKEGSPSDLSFWRSFTQDYETPMRAKKLISYLLKQNPDATMESKLYHLTQALSTIGGVKSMYDETTFSLSRNTLQDVIMRLVDPETGDATRAELYKLYGDAIKTPVDLNDKDMESISDVMGREDFTRQLNEGVDGQESRHSKDRKTYIEQRPSLFISDDLHKTDALFDKNDSLLQDFLQQELATFTRKPGLSDADYALAKEARRKTIMDTDGSQVQNALNDLLKEELSFMRINQKLTAIEPGTTLSNGEAMSSNMVVMHSTDFARLWNTTPGSVRDQYGLKKGQPLLMPILRQPSDKADTFAWYKVVVDDVNGIEGKMGLTAMAVLANHSGDFDGDAGLGFIPHPAEHTLALKIFDNNSRALNVIEAEFLRATKTFKSPTFEELKAFAVLRRKHAATIDNSLKETYMRLMHAKSDKEKLSIYNEAKAALVEQIHPTKKGVVPPKIEALVKTSWINRVESVKTGPAIYYTKNKTVLKNTSSEAFEHNRNQANMAFDLANVEGSAQNRVAAGTGVAAATISKDAQLDDTFVYRPVTISPEMEMIMRAQFEVEGRDFDTFYRQVLAMERAAHAASVKEIKAGGQDLIDSSSKFNLYAALRSEIFSIMEETGNAHMLTLKHGSSPLQKAMAMNMLRDEFGSFADNVKIAEPIYADGYVLARVSKDATNQIALNPKMKEKVYSIQVIRGVSNEDLAKIKGSKEIDRDMTINGKNVLKGGQIYHIDKANNVYVSYERAPHSQLKIADRSGGVKATVRNDASIFESAIKTRFDKEFPGETLLGIADVVELGKIHDLPGDFRKMTINGKQYIAFKTGIAITEDTSNWTKERMGKIDDYTVFMNRNNSNALPFMGGLIMKPDETGGIKLDNSYVKSVADLTRRKQEYRMGLTNAVPTYQRLTLYTLAKHLPESAATDKTRIHKYIQTEAAGTEEGMGVIADIINKHYSGGFADLKLSNMEKTLLSKQLYELMLPMGVGSQDPNNAPDGYTSKGAISKMIEMNSLKIPGAEARDSTDPYLQDLGIELGRYMSSIEFFNILLGGEGIVKTQDVFDAAIRDRLPEAPALELEKPKFSMTEHKDGLTSKAKLYVPTPVDFDKVDIQAPIKHDELNTARFNTARSAGTREAETGKMHAIPRKKFVAEEMLNFILGYSNNAEQNMMNLKGFSSTGQKGAISLKVPSRYTVAGEGNSVRSIYGMDDTIRKDDGSLPGPGEIKELIRKRYANSEIASRRKSSTDDMDRKLDKYLGGDDEYSDADFQKIKSTFMAKHTEQQLEKQKLQDSFEQARAALSELAPNIVSPNRGSSPSDEGYEYRGHKRTGDPYQLKHTTKGNALQRAMDPVGYGLKNTADSGETHEGLQDYNRGRHGNMVGSVMKDADNIAQAIDKEVQQVKMLLPTKEAHEAFEHYIALRQNLDKLDLAKNAGEKSIIDSNLRELNTDVEKAEAYVKVYERYQGHIAEQALSIAYRVKERANQLNAEIFPGAPQLHLYDMISGLKSTNAAKKKGDVYSVIDMIFREQPIVLNGNTQGYFDRMRALSVQFAKRQAVENMSEVFRNNGLFNNAIVTRTLNEMVEESILAGDEIIKNSDATLRLTMFEIIERNTDISLQIDKRAEANVQYKTAYDILKQHKANLIEKNIITGHETNLELKSLAHKNGGADLKKALAIDTAMEQLKDSILAVSPGIQSKVVDILKKYSAGDQVLVDRFGRKTATSQNDPAILKKPLTEFDLEYIKENLSLHSDAYDVFERRLAMKALNGEIYLTSKDLADHLDKQVFTATVPSKFKEALRRTGRWSTKWIMSHPLKLVRRLMAFTGYDAMMISTVAPRAVLRMPAARREISAFMQSKGAVLPTKLQEYLVDQGVSPLTAKGYDPVLMEGSANQEGIGKAYFDAVGKLFSQQSMIARYSLYTEVKESFDKGDPYYGPAYGKKNAIDAMSTSGKKAISVVDSLIGGAGGFPSLARTASSYGFVFTTFPLGVARWGIESGATIRALMDDVLTDGLTSEHMKNIKRSLVTPTVSIGVSSAIISLIIGSIANLFGVDESEKERMLEEKMSFDPLATLLSDYPITVQENSMHQLQAIADMAKPYKEEDWNFIQKTLGSFAKNVLGHANPLAKNAAEIAAGKDLYGHKVVDHDFKVTENAARKLFGYFIGASGAHNMMKDWAGNENAESFAERIKPAMAKAVEAEMGNTKVYKAQKRNYYNAMSIVNGHIAERRKSQAESRGYTEERDWTLSRKIADAVHDSEGPVAIYSIIADALSQGRQPNDIKAALSNNTIQGKLKRISAHEDIVEFWSGLDEKARNSIEKALEYEAAAFPFLEDILEEVREQDNTYRGSGYSPYIPRTKPYSNRRYPSRSYNNERWTPRAKESEPLSIIDLFIRRLTDTTGHGSTTISDLIGEYRKQYEQRDYSKNPTRHYSPERISRPTMKDWRNV